MDRWTLIERTFVPGSKVELTLSRFNDDFAIRIPGQPGDLMNSRKHFSEDTLAELGCAGLSGNEQARVLVGGLGMGFTLATVLKIVGSAAEVIVAELVPAVVEWNRGPLGECAGRPLQDERTHVYPGDVADLLQQGADHFDAILLDVDNGPEAMAYSGNEWLYSPAGLHHIYEKLRPEGVVAIWSARADPVFAKRLEQSGFSVQLRKVRERPGKGSRHTIFIAQKPRGKNAKRTSAS